jgi:hypothetical protein
MRDDFRRLSPDAKLRSPHGGEEFDARQLREADSRKMCQFETPATAETSLASPPDGQILVVRFEPGVFSPQRHGQVSRIGNGN